MIYLTFGQGEEQPWNEPDSVLTFKNKKVHGTYGRLDNEIVVEKSNTRNTPEDEKYSDAVN